LKLRVGYAGCSIGVGKAFNDAHGAACKVPGKKLASQNGLVGDFDI
jgi:F0F1-type ATP synthase membrane subunit c/vacuolar-type H+-ATPase subunit K